ncbi:DUF7715 family protein [Geodermatophilus sp. SYSU D00079]
MKLLTATYTGQGEQDGDFCSAVEGELVLVGDVCAADQADPDPDGGCGCGRAFTGLSSHRGTTTALVRDLDFSAEDLHLAVETHLAASGFGPELLGDEDFADLVEETVREAVAFARWWPVGTVLGRRLDVVRSRSLPSGAENHRGAGDP